MLSHPLGMIAAVPRDRLFWWVLATLVGGQLLALWMLCSHQVRKAQVRDATLQVQRVAVADCLRYIPRATLNSCASRVDPDIRPGGNMLVADDKQAAAAAGRATMSSATAVRFSY